MKSVVVQVRDRLASVDYCSEKAKEKWLVGGTDWYMRHRFVKKNSMLALIGFMVTYCIAPDSDDRWLTPFFVASDTHCRRVLSLI